MKPAMAVSYMTRGLLYYEVGQSAGADRDLRKALTLRPELETGIEEEMERIRLLPATFAAQFTGMRSTAPLIFFRISAHAAST